MKYMLDTNICIYLINNKPTSVKQNLESIPPENVFISSITASEIWYGIYKSKFVEKNIIAFLGFLSTIKILPYDENAAIKYGEIRAELEKSGNIIGSNDMLIAAHALSLDYSLVTNNEQEFRRIKQLTVLNWV
ncbi:MAG: VapC toxin family PIN domain ribonuclease [Ignavibacteriales bacterium CG18_big_fil_WC_8_21_14_2_50_31_20]|nr:MAG: VapC toxin family PIN domain ribonuclease [Ignavibacteriales bacterium CG18_big_fil_WC_8_21_14_2_50_31_20]